MTHKLLLADDSLTIQRVVELTFAGEDVQVIAVADGEQAIARIPVEKPDIVLADIGTPQRSGYDVAAFVKGHPDLSHIPVLLLAGAFEPPDEARVKQSKCDGVLVKPFEPQQVIARVRELVRGGTSASPARSEGEQPEGDSLEDYFARLDAAFATLGQGSPSLRDDDDVFRARFGELDKPPAAVPTIDELLGGASLLGAPGGVPPPGRIAPPPIEPADTTPTLASAPPPRALGQDPWRPAVTGQGGSNVVADVFKLLFAVEQGDADAATVRVGPRAAPVEISDELVEQVTRRVLERLAPGAARDVVAEIVSNVAERLVREEIERIRKAPRAKG